MSSSFFLGRILPIFVLTSFVVGCGGSGVSVSGTVTHNGKPVEKGRINFHPTEGKGAPVGGEISGGKYHVTGVTPGKNKVEVVSTVVSGPVASSMEDSVKAAKDKDVKGSPDDISPNAEGNNKTHDIASGTELNLDLKTSLGSDGKPR